MVGECDDNGRSPNDGTLVITGLAQGKYILFESETPDGYVTAADVPFTVNVAADNLSITVTNVAIDSPGNLIITKVNATGTLFVDACFVAFVDTGGQAGEYANGTCDWDDGASDGSMVIPSLAPDTLVVRETLAPDGYRFGGEWMVSLPGTGAGATRLGVENVFGGTTVTFNTLGENGAPLGDVCFDVHLDNGSGLATDGSYITSGCTDPDVTLTGFPAGRYILIVYEWPAGYYEPGNILFVVAVGTSDQDVGVQLLPETTIDALIRRLIEILTDILASM